MKTNRNKSFAKRLQLIFLFATMLAVGALHLSFARHTDKPLENAIAVADSSGVNDEVDNNSLFESLGLQSMGLSPAAFQAAMQGHARLKAEGKLANDAIITIADFSKPSTERRLFIVDVENQKLLFHTYVAHGRNSGGEMAASFSNTMSSFKSSPGFYVTGSTYMGGNGYSLRLHGQERGINDRALERAIVMHGADYVSPSTIRSLGYLGRSYGCPAVSMKEARPIINSIKEGTCLFIYSPSPSYTRNSSFVNS